MNQNLDIQSNAAQNLELETKLTSSQVAAYLQQHPGFFEQHLDLLHHMTVPHPTGSAVSLISKQLELFRKRHHDLENKLNELIEIAQENDALFSRMHELTLVMLEASTLEDAVAALYKVLSDCFLTDFVALRIFQHNPGSPVANLFVEPNNENLQLFARELAENQPRCGRPTMAQGQFLFGETAVDVKSCAIIPMTFNNLQAIVAFGSREKDRFHYSMGNLFLTQMGEIIGTRLTALLSAKDAVEHR